MTDRTIRYEVRWDNGDVDSLSCFRWGTPDKCAEAARVLVNHWARIGFHGTVVQITEEPVYRHPSAYEQEKQS